MGSYEMDANPCFEEELFVMGQDSFHNMLQEETSMNYATAQDFSQQTGFSSSNSQSEMNFYPTDVFPGFENDCYMNGLPSTVSFPYHQIYQFCAAPSFLPMNHHQIPSHPIANNSFPDATHETLPELSNLSISHASPPWSGTSFSSAPSTTVSTQSTPCDTTRRQKQLRRASAPIAAPPRAKRYRTRAATASTMPAPSLTRVPTTPRTTATSQRAMQDRILLEGKNQGLSYKEILDNHDFGVAESTLRGRYRHLTQDAEQRARNPVWFDNDVVLLLRAVPVFRRVNGKPKVLWDSVGKYIYENGGSRKFSGKTCHVKYTEQTGKHW